MTNLKTAIKRSRRHLRTRAKIHGTADRPRLSVAITNRHVIAQLVDDDKGSTLVHSTSVSLPARGSLSKKAEAVGADIASKAKKSKIKQVVLDRGARRYHGRIKALAESARAGGLEF